IKFGNVACFCCFVRASGLQKASHLTILLISDAFSERPAREKHQICVFFLFPMLFPLDRPAKSIRFDFFACF
ncbi:MAG: hypothetical protein J6N53_06825, partial [Lachnospiraceae bacterium]|nr:hypothetical protein [Lachnospiraceae bacterium]